MIAVRPDEKDSGTRLPEVPRPDQGMNMGVTSPDKNHGWISRKIHSRLGLALQIRFWIRVVILPITGIFSQMILIIPVVLV